MMNNLWGGQPSPLKTNNMKIEQITITQIAADEGKLLRMKKNGVIYDSPISLGYNYFEAGVGLLEPSLLKPDDFDEIDKPEDYMPISEADPVKTLKSASEAIRRNIEKMNSLGLSAVEALEVKDWYPKWGDEGFKQGDTVTKGTKFQFGDKLYAVLQDHTILAHYEPSINTAALYVEVTPDYSEEGEENGTLENPIPYEGNMALENGKYYSQDGVVYLCNRDTGNPVYHALKDLVGLYVEVVE